MGLKDITAQGKELSREDFILGHTFYTTLPSDGSVVGIEIEKTDDGIIMMDSSGTCYSLCRDVYNFSNSTSEEKRAWYDEFQRQAPKTLKH
jgi:hypothetical protein